MNSDVQLAFFLPQHLTTPKRRKKLGMPLIPQFHFCERELSPQSGYNRVKVKVRTICIVLKPRQRVPHQPFKCKKAQNQPHIKRINRPNYFLTIGLGKSCPDPCSLLVGLSDSTLIPTSMAPESSPFVANLSLFCQLASCLTVSKIMRNACPRITSPKKKGRSPI